MRIYNSRLQSVEEKRNMRSAVLFILLTVVVIFLLYFVGVPLFGKLAVFISDLRGSGKSITKTDITPPAPPHFNSYPQFTNQQTASISGITEPGATVKLTFNGTSQDALSNKEGAFSFTVQLASGDNTFAAYAVDPAGNVSQKTKDFTITFDNKPPELTITSPSDNSSFFGSNQRQVTIQGTTDPGSQVLINDRIITVDDTGSFQYTTTLNDGANQLAIKSTDGAGNTTEKSITLNFTP